MPRTHSSQLPVYLHHIRSCTIISLLTRYRSTWGCTCAAWVPVFQVINKQYVCKFACFVIHLILFIPVKFDEGTMFFNVPRDRHPKYFRYPRYARFVTISFRWSLESLLVCWFAAQFLGRSGWAQTAVGRHHETSACSSPVISLYYELERFEITKINFVHESVPLLIYFSSTSRIFAQFDTLFTEIQRGRVFSNDMYVLLKYIFFVHWPLRLGLVAECLAIFICCTSSKILLSNGLSINSFTNNCLNLYWFTSTVYHNYLNMLFCF